MTALSGSFVVNASSGSDSTASGLGPTTAVSFTGTIDVGTAPNDVQTSDSTGTIAAGDVLYAGSISSGRKFNVVASVVTALGTTTITCDHAWGANFTGTVVCGGKRATLTNMVEVCDATLGFDNEIKLESDVDLDANMTCGSSRSVYIYSDDASTRRVITTNQLKPLQGGLYRFEGLEFRSDYGAGAELFASDATYGLLTVTARNCIFGDTNDINNFDALSRAERSSQILNYIKFDAMNCMFVNCDQISAFWDVNWVNCYFKENDYINYPNQPGSTALYKAGFLRGQVVNCIFENTASNAYIDASDDGRYVVWLNNIFDGLTGNFANDVFRYDSTSFGASGYPCTDFHFNLLTNCSYVGNEAEGKYNQLYNTSNNITGLSNSITLSTDPYVNRAGGDIQIKASEQAQFETSWGNESIKQYAYNYAAAGGFRRIGFSGGING